MMIKMKDEKEVNYTDRFDGIDIECVKKLCESVPFWSNKPHYSVPFWSWRPHYFESNYIADSLKRYYLEYRDNKPIRVRWERIHGWKRKVLKLAIHNRKKCIKTQYDALKKYKERNIE